MGKEVTTNDYVMAQLVKDKLARADIAIHTATKALHDACSAMIVAMGGEVKSEPGLCLFHGDHTYPVPYTSIKCTRVFGEIIAESESGSTKLSDFDVQKQLDISFMLERLFEQRFNDEIYHCPPDVDLSSGINMYTEYTDTKIPEGSKNEEVYTSPPTS